MAFSDTKYSRLTSLTDPEEYLLDDDVDPDSRYAQQHRKYWSNIHDLDDWFKSVYNFWNVKGFLCFVLEEIMSLLQFAFIIGLSLFMTTSINYGALIALSPKRVHLDEVLEKYYKEFHNSTFNASHFPQHYVTVDSHNTSFWNTIFCDDFVKGRSNWFWYLFITFAILFFLYRLVRMTLRLFQMWRVRGFYRDVLEVDPSQMDNYTWPEVLKQLVQAQNEYCSHTHRRKLTELDIHNQIMRYKNFLIALVNKKMLPTELHVPCFGSVFHFTEQLKYMYEMMLFWGGSWSLFQNASLAKDFHTAPSEVFTAKLRSSIKWYAVCSFIASPLIFIWTFFYTLSLLVELFQRKDSPIGFRKWSPYARQKLRLFNELDHQFDLRLARAYHPAKKYVDSFTSPLLVILAKKLMFFASAILAVLLIFTFVDESLLVADNMPLTIASLVGIISYCRAIVPDEGDMVDPEVLLHSTVLNTIEGPTPDWRGKAHTIEVRRSFRRLFQSRLVFLIEHLLSPFTTPFILYFHVRPKSHDIIMFFRNFSVSVQGVGDVCSFALLDVGRNGNPNYSMHKDENTSGGNRGASPPSGGGNKGARPSASSADDSGEPNHDSVKRSEDGKMEMSIINFSLSNPGWQPPAASRNFMKNLMESVEEDVNSPTESQIQHAVGRGAAGTSSDPATPDAHHGPHGSGSNLMPMDASVSLYPQLAPAMHGSQASFSASNSIVYPAAQALQSLSLVSDSFYPSHHEVRSAWPSPTSSRSRNRATHGHQLANGVGHTSLYFQNAVARRRQHGNGYSSTLDAHSEGSDLRSATAELRAAVPPGGYVPPPSAKQAF